MCMCVSMQHALHPQPSTKVWIRQPQWSEHLSLDSVWKPPTTHTYSLTFEHAVSHLLRSTKFAAPRKLVVWCCHFPVLWRVVELAVGSVAQQQVYLHFKHITLASSAWAPPKATFCPPQHIECTSGCWNRSLLCGRYGTVVSWQQGQGSWERAYSTLNKVNTPPSVTETYSHEADAHFAESNWGDLQWWNNWLTNYVLQC